MSKIRDRIKNSPPLPLKWQIFRYFAAFALVLIVILWLVQTVFLDDIYEGIKLSEMKNAAKRIALCVNSDSFTESAEEISAESGICLLVYSDSGKRLVSCEMRFDCLIHHLDSDTLGELYAEAKNNGGEFVHRFKRSLFAEDGASDGGKTPELDDSIVLTKITEKADGSSVILMLNTVIAPVAATVSTIRVQLICVSVLMLILALFLALAMSKTISRPIAKLNNSAKALAAGRYDADFSVASGCSEVENLSETLAYAAKEISKVDRMQKELIANISHDLRTPLTLIKGYGEVMRDIPGEMTSENMQVVIDETERLSSLVSDLVDVSKFNAGNQTLERSDFDLSETVSKTLGRYSRLTERDGYRILLDSKGSLVVNADKTRILQVIYNLINNAVNYAGEDKTVAVSTGVNGEYARVEVTDHGEGIPPEKLPLIWDRYYKIDGVHRRAAIGTGLGLSIVKNIINLHGGRYGVTSTVGEGSTFWFELKLKN